MCIANSREFSSKIKYFVSLKRARDYYFKMTFFFFIIINHMYVYCELESFHRKWNMWLPWKGQVIIILKDFFFLPLFIIDVRSVLRSSWCKLSCVSINFLQFSPWLRPRLKKLHAYHYTRVQHLREEDYRRRKRFCEYFLRRVNEDPEFPSRIIFSDESLFTREGIFNSHNMHMWDEENPRVTRLRNYQVRWKLNVWAGIMDTKILGPVILPERLTGASYTEFLAENLPDFLEEIPLFNRNKIIFQQDGAGPHNARIVTNFLNEQFPGRWMGRYGPIRWPARSPDLNPLDFFLWGYCKEIMYRQPPENVEELNDKLHHAIFLIEDEVMEKIEENLLKRMRACITMNGGHFEHLL